MIASLAFVLGLQSQRTLAAVSDNRILKRLAPIVLRRTGEFTPFPPVQLAATGFGTESAPLFEEKRDLLLPALIADFTDPSWVHEACARSAFTAHDYPINSA